MKVSKRAAIAATIVATAGAVIPAAMASNNPQGGTGNGMCADGSLTWTPNNIWPPNHKMQTVDIYYTAPSDTSGDQTTITVGAITDNQAASDGSDELNGSGQPTAQQGPDWSGTGNSDTVPEGQTAHVTAQVRAERSGTDQSGRTYSIQLMCSESNSRTMTMDPNGTGMTTITVSVPHDQRKP